MRSRRQPEAKPNQRQRLVDDEVGRDQPATGLERCITQPCRPDAQEGRATDYRRPRSRSRSPASGWQQVPGHDFSSRGGAGDHEIETPLLHMIKALAEFFI
jgi:hypothetical protein